MVMKRLHPGARWQFRIGAYFALIPVLLFFGFFLINAFVTRAIISSMSTGQVNAPSFGNLYLFIPILIISVIIFGEIYARLAYNNWAYEFGDHSLKLESGIIWKRYSNIPYERVQNIDITRGILARLIGFSTMDVQTAGAAYGNRGAFRSEGHIPAVDINFAEETREFLMKKISRKSGGL